MQPTYMQKPKEVQRAWHVVDAKNRILGEVATEVAQLIIGKHKPTFTPHVDGGDYVVVINAAQVAVTGNKPEDKMYYRHTGRPGGLKVAPFNEVIVKNPARVIEQAVAGMLPKNKLRSPRLRRLRVFAAAEHTYQDKLKQG